ncbi:XRE family transcriptional regulator [Microvirga sp. GCM10011540]|uniref:XRE family transcriptional regulator n=1 Tax=Microvirga sp. GCM10011540 TaxID=3317338 RepID=UPI003619C690
MRNGMWQLPDMESPAARLKWARERAGYKTAKDAVTAFGWSQSTYYGHENGDRSFSPDTAKRYAQAFNVPWSWLLGDVDEGPPEDAARKERKPNTEPNASSPVNVSLISQDRVPVYGLAIGGTDGRFEFNGQIVDQVFRPPVLANVANAYAVFVSGDSMEPRYFAGETVYVHPGKPVRKGHFVVVQIRGDEGQPPHGYVKQFVAWTPSRLVLRQYNPDEEMEFDRNDVISVHRIVFSGET